MGVVREEAEQKAKLANIHKTLKESSLHEMYTLKIFFYLILNPVTLRKRILIHNIVLHLLGAIGSSSGLEVDAF